MSKRWRIVAVLAVLLLFLGDYLYWTTPFYLKRVIPGEEWTKAQLWYYNEHFDAQEILVDGETLQKIMSGFNAERVTNRPGFRTLSQPYFMLYLYYDEGCPCSVTIVENGDISIAAELDTDHRKYFDGGEELFEYLKTFVPGKTPHS